MRVTWSDQAVQAIQEQFGLAPIALKLVYDTEGCGCAVNGVAALWAVEGPEDGDMLAEGGPDGIGLWYDKQQEIFWDEDLRISYHPDRRTFGLASDGQIYSNRLVIQDRRGMAIAE